MRRNTAPLAALTVPGWQAETCGRPPRAASHGVAAGSSPQPVAPRVEGLPASQEDRLLAPGLKTEVHALSSACAHPAGCAAGLALLSLHPLNYKAHPSTDQC